MATILLCALPLPSATNSSLKLASSLRNRGHEIVYLGIQDGAVLIEPYGYRFISVFEDWLPLGLVKQWTRSNVEIDSPLKQIRFLLGERKKLLYHQTFIDFLIGGGYREYLKAVDNIKPDLILIDATLHTHWATLAYRSGVKSLYFNPGLPISEDPVIPPLNTALPPGTDPESKAAVRKGWNDFLRKRWIKNKLFQLAGIADWVEHQRKLARVLGYPLERFNIRTELMPLLDFPMLIMCPQAFEFAEAGERPNIHYSQAFIELDRKEPEFPWDKINNDKMLIYCSLGSLASSASFYQRVINAVAQESSWQLVLNLGPELKVTAFHGMPDDAILVNGAPQLSLLRRSAVMINHGGIGTVKECIYFAVPQISFPIYFDQPGAAARVQYHGLGTMGDLIRSTAADIHRLLMNTISDTSIKSRTLAMSQVFQAIETTQAGATLIEFYLPTH